MKHYAVIGSPVSHSRSPEIYLSLFERYGVDADFTRIEIGLGDLPERWEELCGLDGFAVTMPLKRAIIPYLECLDESAEGCGAVNFVLNRNGRTTGYNTDGGGLTDAIEETGFPLAGSAVVLLGRGGAAYAAARELKRRDCSVSLLVRTPSEDAAYPEFVLPDVPGRADVFITATPLGMKGGPDFSDFDLLDRIGPRLVFDMVYVPGSKTSLIAAAEERGMKAIDGTRMLYRQALRSFRIMTGITVK